MVYHNADSYYNTFHAKGDQAFTIRSYFESGWLFYLLGLVVGIIVLIDIRQNGKGKRSFRCRIGWHKYKLPDGIDTRLHSKADGPITYKCMHCGKEKKAGILAVMTNTILFTDGV